ncbi:MAG: Rrf2 family transcriptional regulator [Bacteroidia bacterium]
MFSKTCEYAIKAVLYIATAPEENNLFSLNAIAKAIDSPNAYTSKILQQLAKTNIIQSVKGHAGGYFIAKNNLSTLFLSDIVDAIDGDGICTSCGLGLKQCSAKNPCPLHDQFMQIRTDIKLMLKKTSIKQMADGISEKDFSLKR